MDVCHCNLFSSQLSLYGVGLDSKCRNPNGAEQPWCYINLQNCDTDYCDVSGHSKFLELYWSAVADYKITDKWKALRDCNKHNIEA